MSAGEEGSGVLVGLFSGRDLRNVFLENLCKEVWSCPFYLLGIDQTWFFPLTLSLVIDLKQASKPSGKEISGEIHSLPVLPQIVFPGSGMAKRMPVPDAHTASCIALLRLCPASGLRAAPRCHQRLPSAASFAADRWLSSSTPARLF